eukprot:76650_1
MMKMKLINIVIQQLDSKTLRLIILKAKKKKEILKMYGEDITDDENTVYNENEIFDNDDFAIGVTTPPPPAREQTIDETAASSQSVNVPTIVNSNILPAVPSESIQSSRSNRMILNIFRPKAIQTINSTISWDNSRNKAVTITVEVMDISTQKKKQQTFVNKLTINKDSISFTITSENKSKNICVDNSKIHHMYLIDKPIVETYKDNSYFKYFSAPPPPIFLSAPPPPPHPTIPEAPDERIVWLSSNA